MGHKIILCVNERGILLTSLLCSCGRGSAAGGRGDPGLPPQRGAAGQYQASVQTRGPSLSNIATEARATGGLTEPWEGGARRVWVVGLRLVLVGMNLCVLLHLLLCPGFSSGLRKKGRCPAQMYLSEGALEIPVKA
jgi:hypothetical protein